MYNVETIRIFGNIFGRALEEDFSAVGRPASADRLLWQGNARLGAM